MENDPILGIDSVSMEYNLETVDSLDLGDLGFLQIIDTGHIQSTVTCNKSDDKDLLDFPTVDIRNSIEKDLIKFTNKKAMNSWGKKKADDLREQLVKYFNRLIKKGFIQNPCPDPIIGYDEEEKTVTIDLKVAYFDSAEKFSITLSGNRGKLNTPKKEN